MNFFKKFLIWCQQKIIFKLFLDTAKGKNTS